MAVKLNSTGGGSVTLDSPSTASNYTVTLPSAAGTLATTTGTGSVFTNPTINGFTGNTSAITIGTTQFVKDASGNVGIGRVPTSLKLEVAGKMWVQDATLPTAFFGNTLADYLATFYDPAAKIGYVTADGAGTQLSFRTVSTERMRLDSSGNLGLNVTPNSGWAGNGAFENQGGSIWSNAPSVNYYLQNAYFGSGSLWRYRSNNPAAMYHQYLGNHYWNTATAGTAGNAITWNSVMTLDSSGNLTVGYISTVSSGVINSYVNVNHITGSATSSSFVNFQYNGSQIGNVSQNGTTGVLYNITSDQRLKENIVDAPNALSSINAIKVRSFDWKADGSHSEYGYIAQELLEVAPEAVHVPVDPEEMMGVDFGKLTPRLVKAIQELSAQNNALEARLAKLEAK